MPAIAMEELCDILKSNKDKKVVLTFHTVGDRDAVGSAMALAQYFSKSKVVTPDFITNNAKRMLAYLNMNDKILTDLPEAVDLVLVLDANNTFALGRLGDRLVPSLASVVFIDHHALHKETEMKASIFNDESYNSTSSIICEVMKKLGAEVNKDTAILLLNGIVADSAEMQNSSPLTFQQVSELLKVAKLDFSFFSEYFHENIPLKNRYQVLKDVSAAAAEVVGKYILVYGRAEEHANVVADAALKLEADASVFWVTSRTEASVSARLRPPLDKKLSMHLGVIMEDIGTLVGGSGGGHACAAGAYGVKREEAQVAGMEAVKRIREKLKQDK